MGEYVDERGNRRISYNRTTQNDLDYIEVFFDRIEDGQYIFRRDPRVKQREERAILVRDGVRYLAPELVLLFKSNDLSEKNLMDFDAAIGSLDTEAVTWLKGALSLIYAGIHPGLER